jgi:hypothetical protein
VQHSGTSKLSPMTCAEFEASFDRYVDETLDAAMMNSCSCHIASCRNCDREVTRWQQTRILLSTAVADFSTAVDVSSLRSDVFAALGFAEGTTDKRQGATREAAYDRGSSVSTRRSAARPARRAASGERRNTFGAVLRFASAATVSAIAAAAAVMVISPAPQGTSTPTQQFASSGSVSPATLVANNAVRPSGVGVRPASLARAARRNSLAAQAVAPVAYSRPPLRKPEVSHVDALEAGQGQRVATWVQDSTGARVIWVENGGPVRRAGLSR